MDANMVDEDSKQLIRDILSTQREQLALSLRIAEDQARIVEDQARQISAYAANTDLYRQKLSDWQLKRDAWRWADGIRAITALGIALLLGYVVLLGLHGR